MNGMGSISGIIIAKMIGGNEGIVIFLLTTSNNTQEAHWLTSRHVGMPVCRPIGQARQIKRTLSNMTYDKII